MSQVGLLQSVVDELVHSGIDLRALGLGWARAAPAIVLIPGFGLRALPATSRMWFSLLLGLAIAPAMSVHVDPATPWSVAIIGSALRGLPVAVSAAVPLWAATMTGGVVDALRGSSYPANSTVVEPGATGTGVLFSLLASLIFLSTGGPARVAHGLLVGSDLTLATATRVALDISSGIQIAVAIAAPVLAASIIIEIANGLITRSAAPAQIFALLAPLRSFAVLAVAAFSLERMVRLLAVFGHGRPLP